MPTPLTPQELDVLLANLDRDREKAGERYSQIRLQFIRRLERQGFVEPEELADETFSQVARQMARGSFLQPNLSGYLDYVASLNSLRKKRFQNLIEARVRPAIPPAEESNPVSSAPVSTQPTNRQAPPLEHLRHLLQTRFPLLYAQVLEPTLADLRQEHSAALDEGRPWKARYVLLQGLGALATAAICQIGVSLLGRIAALWQARSPK